ncbi:MULTISPECIES: class I SAM-dependent methyltransferase [unclassified Halanaerobium]|uniref:class I SAM-dependent DNA methyltransferase n=1 Tax=unclassified Halanaerobium TaxID=2641197 RepID=UPI000DF12371|nr:MULTISPECIES: class I SAM-dependent methyltransferase [unclassified Halanaerobium]RCW41846.1 methyltransferase family protein [Halanaerobium sp. MA284_MarDTE_T2]RCW88000.1 methyltransferase family protein [Halanaerobium sp. DL-01]
MSDSYTRYFAEIYDDIMRAVPYDSWLYYLQDLIDYYKADTEKILELACGTANMTVRLSRLKEVKHITAVDLSPEMLKKAAEKINTANTEVEFVQGNMKEIEFDKKFTLIVSFFDSINYLTKEEDLANLFNNAASVLTHDGLFIFDMNSIGRINTIKEKKTLLEGDNYSCLWEDIVYRDKDIWQVRLKICLKGDNQPCYEELHSERGYKIKKVKQLLSKNGFRSIEVLNAFSFRKGKDSSNRLYFIASPQKKRLKNNRGIIKKLLFLCKNDIKNIIRYI